MKGFNQDCSMVMSKAYEFASKSGGLVGTEHIVCGMLSVDCPARKMLEEFNLNKNNISQFVKLDMKAVDAVTLSNRSRNAIYRASEICAEMGEVQICSDILLIAIVEDSSSFATKGLVAMGVDIDKLKEMVSYGNIKRVLSMAKNSESSQADEPKDESIESLGCDMTQKAKENKLDPVIGRSQEIDRIIQILSRRTKNNPVLIGEPGVGKSAIVEGLAQAIVKGEVPEMLKGKRVFSLDIASLLAGTKYRGEMEERLKKAIDSFKKDGKTILFIDEIHTIVGAGSAGEGNIDVANILKPQLARGELQTIGATTIEEYRKYIEKDSALERRFQPIMVQPPSVEDTKIILKGLREKYEQHHGVTISDEAISSAAELSDRYISDRFLPDKAIDLIDEAASRKRIGASLAPKEIKDIEEEITKLQLQKKHAQKQEDYLQCNELKKKIDELNDKLNESKKSWNNTKNSVDLIINEEDIAIIVSSWTGVPVVKLTQTESQKLINLESILHKRVIGQEEAVKAISKAVRRARVGIKDPNRPIGSFIFLGATGVGKTELSKALAEAMFGDENLMIRIDMSEYMDKISVSKLIGSAPGYVGYDEGGQLTEKVRRKPYSVVLFDEIEKAHPEVFNILLQILEDGRLTDSHGRVVSFKNTIIIMTSNIGAGEIKSTKLGFGNNEQVYEDMKDKQMQALKKSMKPEFINRIDDIVIFRSLVKEDMGAICDLMINSLIKRLEQKQIFIEINQEARQFIVENGFNAEYGARPLRRAVQKYIEDEISEQILLENFAIGDKVVAKVENDKIVFNLKGKENSDKEKAKLENESEENSIKDKEVQESINKENSIKEEVNKENEKQD